MIDINTHKWINLSKFIRIENRWFGNTVKNFIGVTKDKDSIIGTCSLVTKDVPSNCVVAVNPTRVTKNEVS